MKILAIAFLLILAGCATAPTDEERARLEQELTPQPVNEVVKEEAAATEPQQQQAEADSDASEDSEEKLTRYSDLSNMAPPSDRQYKRMTRKRMEEESELGSTAGSLWKMEGQTSYLFAENKHRREGDPTTIKMEGSALKAIENKVAVIQDLLNELEAQKTKAEEENKRAQEEKLKLARLEEEKKLRAERIARGEIVVDPLDEETARLEEEAAAAQAKAESRQPAAVGNTAKKEDKVDLKEVELIPSKIVEKMSSDTYRIRGQQYLTIKKKPYKVIATALIRAEDFNDEGISSNKLLDAQYDVIHVKRTAQ